MKTEQDDPVIAVIFKALSILAVIVGIISLFQSGASVIFNSLPLILGVAPTLWWMGFVATQLHWIARNGERQVLPPKSQVSTEQIPPAPSESILRPKGPEPVEPDDIYKL